MEWLHETWSKTRVFSFSLLRVSFAVLVVLALGLIPVEAQSVTHSLGSSAPPVRITDRDPSGGNDQGAGQSPPIPGAEWKLYFPLVRVEGLVAAPRPSLTPSPRPSSSPSASPSPTASKTVRPTDEPPHTPSASPTDKPSATPSPSATATLVPSSTPSPSATPTFTPSRTPTRVPSATPSPTEDVYPSTYTDKINEVADYSQTDSAYGGFLDGGLNYCAPVAVSDSLMWLSDHGFPNLSGHTSDRKYDQYQLINTLASYFGTDPYSGTGANALVPGLKQYIQARGYTYTSLLLEGWKYVPAEFNTGVKVPNLDWIKRGVLGSGSVWLNVGFYTYSSSTNTYTRYGGHWVALVGYDPTYLIVHNPGLANGSSITNQYTAPTKITSGYLAGGGSAQPSSAVGFYKLSGYSSIHIVDAAVVLQMPTPSSALSLGTVLGPPEPLSSPGTVLTDGD